MAFVNGNPDVKIPIALLFFLIETDNKKILIDVGCDTMPGFLLSKFKKPVEVLEDFGVSKDDITDVLITHAHHDHIDGLRYYKNANVIIHKKETDKAQKYLSEDTKLKTFEKEFSVTENVIIKHIGGHSPGSSIVLVYTEDKPIVFCGDECYLRENLLKQKPTGSSADIKKSTEFVTEYSKPEYKTILLHDAELVKDIGAKRIY